MADFLVRVASIDDVPALAALRATLWPEGTVDEHAHELRPQLQSASDCTLVAQADDALVGFLEGRLRSHADGCETTPVGYLEGWFVAVHWRGRGVGRALVQHFEAWAREHGCRELASDTWLDNVGSQKAHEQLGFSEVDRVVTYRKSLDHNVTLGPHARPPLKLPGA